MFCNCNSRFPLFTFPFLRILFDKRLPIFVCLFSISVATAISICFAFNVFSPSSAVPALLKPCAFLLAISAYRVWFMLRVLHHIRASYLYLSFSLLCFMLHVSFHALHKHLFPFSTLLLFFINILALLVFLLFYKFWGAFSFSLLLLITVGFFTFILRTILNNYSTISAVRPSASSGLFICSGFFLFCLFFFSYMLFLSFPAVLVLV